MTYLPVFAAPAVSTGPKVTVTPLELRVIANFDEITGHAEATETVELRGRVSGPFCVYPGPVDTDMSRDLSIPKASLRHVANAVLDGIEAGHEDTFPDSFALDFSRQFEVSPKVPDRQFAAMANAMSSGSAASA